MWVNNPSSIEMEKAIEAGAVSCTTNPSYCSKLLQKEPDFIGKIIDRAVRETDDDNAAAERVVHESTARVVDCFRQLYDQDSTNCGFVTIQDDPRRDTDPDAVINAAKRYKELGPNFMIKIPVIAAGCEAIEAMVAENMPICATEIFSIAQAIHICELYDKASKKYGNAPPFYVTHIAGIFDEHLSNVAEEEGIEIAPEVLKQAGCTVSRMEYRLLKERGYSGTMLGGGARGLHHFTELVGGDLHVTINWSTAQEIIEADPPIEQRIDAECSQEVIDELSDKFSDFRKAIEPDALPIEEFEDYGPVQCFRNMFLKGYQQLLDECASRRKAASS